MNKKLFGNKWLELWETPCGYTYSHDGEAAGDGHKVAVVVINPSTGMVLGRYEHTPCHKLGIKLCSITGSVENNNPKATVMHELWEEAGIKADPDKVLPIGEVWPSKSSDTVCHLYMLLWDGEVNDQPVGDGSSGEKGATVKWIHPVEAMASDDPLLPTMMARVHLVKLSELQEA